LKFRELIKIVKPVELLSGLGFPELCLLIVGRLTQLMCQIANPALAHLAIVRGNGTTRFETDICAFRNCKSMA
jgi:hypothetical protein